MDADALSRSTRRTVVSKLKCPVYVASEMSAFNDSTESDLALTEGARRATEVSAKWCCREATGLRRRPPHRIATPSEE